MFTHLHLLVKPTLFGQIAHQRHIGICHGATVHQDAAFIGSGDAGDDADQGGLSGTIGAEQAEHLGLGYDHVDAIEGRVGPETFHDAL